MVNEKYDKYLERQYEQIEKSGGGIIYDPYSGRTYYVDRNKSLVEKGGPQKGEKAGILTKIMNKMKITFDEALREIFEDKALHEMVKQRGEPLTIIENYDNWNRGAEYYRRILIDPICGVVFYNRQLGLYADGDETDDCVSEIVYVKRIEFKSFRDLVKNVQELQKVLTEKELEEALKGDKLMSAAIAVEKYKDTLGGFCNTGSSSRPECYYYKGLDPQKDWGQGKYVVGHRLPKEHVKRITGIKKQTIMRGIAYNSIYRGKSLSEIFR